MTELRQANVPTGLQILVSGLIFGLYHSVGNFDLRSVIPSILFGTVLAALYVLGKRSLAASILPHGLVNLIGEPFLAMMLLVSYAGQ